MTAARPSATTSLAVGAVLDLGQFGPVTREGIVRFAGASGDFNRLHDDDEYSKAAGFPGVFAMGMFPAGVLASAAAQRIGATALRRLAVRFREQVWPGDLLVCSATVTAVTANGDGRRVTLDLTCRRDTGGVAIAGVAEFDFEEAEAFARRMKGTTHD